jgi:hypothetical protein
MQLNGKHEAAANLAKAKVCCPRNGKQALSIGQQAAPDTTVPPA